MLLIGYTINRKGFVKKVTNTLGNGQSKSTRSKQRKVGNLTYKVMEKISPLILPELCFLNLTRTKEKLMKNTVMTKENQKIAKDQIICSKNLVVGKKTKKKRKK